MFGQKLIVVGLLSVSFAIVHATSFSVGQRKTNDKLVWVDHVMAQAVPDKVEVKTRTFLAPNSTIITRVTAEDTKRGGTVTLVNGGPRYRHVSLRFTGRKGEGLFYNVYVYAI